MRDRFLRVLIALCLALGATASCDTKITETPIEITVVDVVAPRTTLNTGETLQLSATPRSADGDGLTARSVTWSSSDEEVARVSGSGLVTARGPGGVRITAASGSVSGSVDLTILLPPSIAVSEANPSFAAVAGLASPPPQTITVTNGGGGTLSGLSLGPIVYVNGTNWLVAALSSTSAPATLTLTPNIAGLAAGTYDAQVTINSPVAPSRTITVRLTLTASFALTIQGAGTGNGTVTGPAGINCTVTAGATSGNCSATFNSGTVVTLTGAAAASNVFSGWSGACAGTGTCTVTMSAPRTVTATFNREITNIVVTPGPHQLHVNWTWSYGATALRANGTTVPNVQFVWSSSNPAVATVTSDGTVTTRSPGTTLIRATAGNVTGEAQLTVTSDLCAPITLQPPGVSIQSAIIAASCMIDGRRRVRFALSSPTSFSILHEQSSSAFTPALSWYAASALVPQRELGTAINFGQYLLIAPAGDYITDVVSFDDNVGNFAAQWTWGGPNPNVTNCIFAVVRLPLDHSGTISSQDCAVGGFFEDHFHVVLRTGEAIVINQSSSALDSYLLLDRWNGTAWINEREDDDSGGGVNSRIQFTAVTAGIYRIRASTFNPGVTGSYTLTTTSNMPGGPMAGASVHTPVAPVDAAALRTAPPPARRREPK